MQKILAGLVAVALLLILVRWITPDETPDVVPEIATSNRDSAVLAEQADSLASQQRYRDYLARAEHLPAPPASLEGTEVDGALEQDADGNLIIDVRVRWVFNYFLATLGEETLDQVKARLAAHIHQSLSSDKAREQAWELFERYLDAEQQVANTLSHDGSISGMTQAISDRNRLRAGWLGQEVADEFFGMEDTYDSHSLEVMAIHHDSTLSDMDKRDRIEALRQQLPEALQEMIHDVHSPGESARVEELLREKGASSSEIHQVREQQFGVEAAERLAQMDREQERWEQRYTHYRSQLDQLEQSGLSSDDRFSEVQRLQQDLFEQQELRRVEAMDRIHAQ